ncbi:MAG: type VI-B CRISPR-associated RNA-guided ribonuclease Cas13b [Muribaculaceae bacterium]|nr:type VI-B CRISPR-associated RNA-guided ribonuclease Cas13b [Muribaculaceae bacterium]
MQQKKKTYDNPARRNNAPGKRRTQSPRQPHGPNPLTVEKYKHVFAAYANMAQFNAFRTVAHISMSLGLDPDGISETRLEKSEAVEALVSPMVEVAEKARRLFERHFPFLLPITDYLRRNNLTGNRGLSEGEVFRSVLRKIFPLLSMLRNHTTHYRDRVNLERISKIEKELALPLRDVLRASVFRVEENYCRHPAPADVRGAAAVQAVVRCVTRIKQDMGRDVFMFRLDEEKDGRVMLSPVGKAFFLCLFLHKKYVAEFLSQIHLFYTSRRNSFGRWEKAEETDPALRGVVLDIFAACRIRLPKARYEAEGDPVLTLGFDILGELQKVPAELLDTLSDGDRARFRLPAPEAMLANDVDNKLYFRRFADRFPQLALRYLDVTRAMENIRFQVRLGTLRYAFYMKMCLDADEPDRLRALQIELNGFGRIDEIEKARRREWAGLLRVAPAGDAAEPSEMHTLRRGSGFAPDTADSAPYITDMRAAYVINASRIGLHWGDTVLTPDGLPVVTVPDGAHGDWLTREKRLARGLDWGVRMQEPQCFLSTYELPALLFHEHLRSLLPDSGSGEWPSAESIIIEKTEAARRFFRSVRDGATDASNFADALADSGLRPDEVPEKLSSYFAGKAPGAQRRQALLRVRYEEMVDDTQRRLKAIDADMKRYADPKNRRGRADFRDVRPGRLADWLAADIVRMQPAVVTGADGRPVAVKKLTGLNFQVLQKSLAVYAGMPALRGMFEDAGLIGAGAASHPFLDSVRRAATTLEFYKEYLQKKRAYLKTLDRDRDYSRYSFLTRGASKWQERTPAYICELAARYADGAVELPRGLFTASIAGMLQRLGVGGIDPAGDNAAWMIARYFDAARHDGPQCFYDSTRFRRSYRLFELLSPDLQPRYLTEEQMARSAAALRGDAMEATVRAVLKARIARSRRVRGAAPVADDEATRTKIMEQLRAARRQWDKNERAIRRYKVQDMVLFMLAGRLLALDSLPDGGDMRLKNLSPIQGEEGKGNILDTPMPYSLVLPLESGRSVRITQPDLKPKNYGDFYTFLNDTRLDTLMAYLDNGSELVEIDREALEREFGEYDRRRTDVFRLVHEIEQNIYERFRAQFDAKEPEIYYFADGAGKMPRLNNFNNLLNLVADGLEAHTILTEVRNAFSHNRYTRKSVVKLSGKGPLAPEILLRFEQSARGIMP